MVKVIFFDLWGTLMDTGIYPSPIKQVKTILRIRGSFPDYVIRFEQTFMTQSYETLSEGFQAVARNFQVSYNQEQLDELVGLWNKTKLLAKPYEDTVEELTKLKKNYKLVLISNTDGFTVEALLEKFKLTDLFDHILLSFKEGCLKTDKELFQRGLKELALTADEAVMVGDSIASDMNGANRAGVKGILLDRRDRDINYPEVIKSLSELEGKLNG